jgi:U3 small nucleolar RNA-associated protein 20
MGLNLSENFTSFARQAGPLCETLAQILHHEDELMDLLAQYIEKRDTVSMEPFLDLLAKFVQDLGRRFEKHFQRAISLVASIAGSHPDVEIIEWSFTCLTYIFKSLSRLLVPDLRPTLEIMVPYLGKERQKAFVTRFAAESMSFLIRKAGTKFKKDKMPLRRTVSFLFQDLEDVAERPSCGSYAEGLMHMFAESIRCIQGDIHSTGADILQCMVEAAFEQRGASIVTQDVIAGTLINVMHNTSAETFAPISRVIIEQIELAISRSEFSAVDFISRLLFVITATRKGKRIKDWTQINNTLLRLLRISPSNSEAIEGVTTLLTATAVILHACPMDQLMPHMQPLMDSVSQPKYSAYFLEFCNLWSRLESGRFESMVLPHLQK